MDTEKNGYLKPNPVKCRTCKYSKGENPFENKPEKSYCIVYSRERGVIKPEDILFHGGDCRHYEME